MRSLLPFVVVVSLAHVATAQKPKVGDPAPPFSLADWLNVEAGHEPTLDSLAGKVVLLEFWGTWCGPCVRAMPEVQKLHDRYGGRGLVVLAISYESKDAMQPFLRDNHYSMRVGSDPQKTVVGAYGVSGWPTSIVIDRDGNIAHIGSPYDAEAAVEAALGLESGPATLLTTWLEAQKAGKDGEREALTRLLEKATCDFDLQAWARANGGAEAAATAGAAPVVASNAAASKADPAALLRQCAAVWSGADQGQRLPLLRQLGDSGATTFDLEAFARDRFAKSFPLTADELRQLLQEHMFSDAIDAIAERNPAPATVALATKDEPLQQYCEQRADGVRTMAKKGLMARHWLFAGVQAEDNEGFFRELSISGIATSPDRKQILGVTLGGAMVHKAAVDSFVRRHLQRTLVMQAIAAGKAPAAKLQVPVQQLGATILQDLIRRYGDPAAKPKK